MSTTSAYGWNIPDNTDLVKDGALAIRTLGNAIDTSMNTALGTRKAGMVLLNTTSFSGVASQAVPSVFSSTYQNYRIVLNLASSTGDTNQIGFKLRVASTDTSTNYNTVRSFSDGVSPGTGLNPLGTDEFYVMDSDKDFNGWSGCIIDLQSPNEARPTHYLTFQAGHNGLGFFWQNVVGVQNSSTQFDGFNLINSVGNTTGVVRVYGYNN